MLKDHRELLHAFNEQSVRYLLVGDYALGIYAEPRATGDLDLFVERPGLLFSRLVLYYYRVLQITSRYTARMSFYFRRSSSFGPFRLNFSKSGIGASVGVKGARLTLSPKGRTYITVGHGGFYYRKNLSDSSGSTSYVPQRKAPDAQTSADEIKTADVEELLESSKGDLVESLNERARMFNPAIVLFVLAGICAAVGLSLIRGAALPDTQPALPASLDISESSRQANRTDEYALLLARYGQPSMVTITQAGAVPLRTATYESVHLAISSVPVGCVDSYVYYEVHKNDIVPSRPARRHHEPSHSVTPPPPGCVPSANGASTIISYQDSTSGSSIDPVTAERYLAGLSSKSNAQPLTKVPETSHPSKREPKAISQPLSIGYDKGIVKAEQERLRVIVDSSRKDTRTGYEFLISALLLLIPSIFVHNANKEKRTTRLTYDLSATATAQQQVLDETLEQLSKSRLIWRVDSQSAVFDWKRNAGASYNVKREQVSVRRAVPPRVESNVVPMCIDLGRLKMFFLPDQVLYWQRGTFASIEYKDLTFQAASTQFIEEQVQTSDSRQVGSTWRYVRKDGGPDRRFNNNRQLPVMLYGVVTAVSSGGLNLVLHTSNVVTASSFAVSFRTFQIGRDHHMFGELQQSSDEHGAKRQEQTSGSYPDHIRQAMSLLGLKTKPTLDQLAVAYRQMAHMYHPDKVVGLGPELQKLAEQRMKEINAAHQLVREYLESV